MNSFSLKRCKRILMKRHIYFILCFLFCTGGINAQVKNLVVETYYISDLNDATDTTGGYLEAGSVTYRIYVQLEPGSKLRKIYGDANHTLRFSTTTNFFNNKADGQSFGKDFTKNRLGENTVALDSWITLGQTTRLSSKTYFGVLKSGDDDGSFIGGANNDGGSAAIPGGLLVNSDPAIGLPLYSSDGNDTMTSTPNSWADYGIIDVSSNVDSTIFGSAKICSEFISNNAGLQNSGVSGVNPDSNYVLVAQLTTTGEISFELNLEVEENDNVGTRIIKYVADGTSLASDEQISPYLKYPRSCGCTDPEFLEYNPAYSCMISDSCKTLIVFGCMDTLACNYDEFANYHVQSLCCYPGLCNDRDISVVCPLLGIERAQEPNEGIYPNPSHETVNFQFVAEENSNVKYEIYDSLGRLVHEQNVLSYPGLNTTSINISDLDNGLYQFKLVIDNEVRNEKLIKN